MAASPLQLALTTGFPLVPALRRVQGIGPESGGFTALSQLAGKVWCTKSQASSGMQEILWGKVFADPTQWWDNRRSKPTAQHPDFTNKKSTLSLCPMGKELWARCIALKDPVWGRRIHGLTVERDAFLATHLIGLYASHRTLEEAIRVFTKVSIPSFYNWATIILAYARHGKGAEATQLYRQMRESTTIIPTNCIYVAVLKACAAAGDLVAGKEVHAHILSSPRKPDIFVQTGLVDMHAKCRSLKAARRSNVHKPSWLDFQLTTLDTRMIGAPGSVSTSVEGQGALGRLGACTGHLEVQMCRKLCEDGRITDAVDALNLLVQRGCHVDNNLFYRLLKRCIVHKDLVLGRRIHALTITSGYEGDAFLATHLIGLYASHGRMQEAMQVFTSVATPDAYNWAAIIFAYARNGEVAEAIRLYRHMRESATVKPTDNIYIAVLKACAIAGDLIAGKEVHTHILESPGMPDIFVQTSLVDMYAKCRRLQDARYLFERLPGRTVVTWNALLAGYAQQGMGQEAISLYKRMQEEGLTPPDSVTYVGVLQACASVGIGALNQGKQLHAQIEEQGLQYDVVLGGSLVNMYAKCGSLEHARSMFDRLPARNVVTWTAMIAGYAEQGMGEEALSLYSSMQQEGITPNSVTFVCLLQACASLGVGALDQGQQLHAQIKERGLQDDVLVGGSLVHMYAKSGRVEDARSVFDRLPTRNVVTWNVMIGGYAQQGMGGEALSLYSSMLQGGLAPDSVTFVCLLQACASLGVGALDHLNQLQTQIEERGLQDDVVLGASLVNMYAKCGSLEDARSVFNRLPARNVVTWTAMIAGYAQQEMGQEALGLYSAMQQEGLTLPDSVAFVCLLQACAIVGPGALNQGKQLHAQIEERGLQDDVMLGGSLVSMYVKCGSLEDARCVFDRLPARNVVTWTAMIAGYSQQQMGQEALTLYTSMQQGGVTPPDSVTFVCLLQACAIVAALPLGKQLHAQIEERGLQADVVVGSALLNMYAKCGSMVDAQQVFDSLPERTIEAWGALIGGYARQGDSEVVFDLLDRMRLEGIQPNGIVFLSVLGVCSHVGLVNKGQKYFEGMRSEYGISPTVEHYTCLMDLLGRAGHLDEALHIALTMPFPPEVAVWLTLLGACWKWKNVEIGQQAFEFAVGVDGTDATFYVLMSNIYASCEMWEEAKEMQVRRLKSGAWKKPGQSWWTDMGGVVHTFVAGDKKHPESEGIYARLEQLVPKMKKEGYVPHLGSSLRDGPDDEKEAGLCGHSEKLAIAYALNRTPEGTTIRVVKNLRVCVDCHTATAYISKVEKRMIICRDASRFHVFKEGECSCGDYW